MQLIYLHLSILFFSYKKGWGPRKHRQHALSERVMIPGEITPYGVNKVQVFKVNRRNVDNRTIDLIETLLNEAPAALLFSLGFCWCRCFEDGRY